MLARWLAKLQQFHFDIVHRPGAQHGNADGLSRCPQCERGSCATTANTGHSEPEQPYANSCEGSSLDSDLIPLESGETCVAAVMIAQSENSKLITTAQKTDSEISIVREWLATGKFPACIQDFFLHYFWPGMSDFVRDRITACHKCIARKLRRSIILHSHSFRHISYLGFGEPSLLCHFITFLLRYSLFVYIHITLDGSN